jgi:hypothetical protein
MFHSRLFVWLMALAAFVLVGCGGSATPQLIGSYPKAISPTYVPPPADLLVVYNAYLNLEVTNPDTAARRAIQLAYDFGGYLVSSQSWYEGNRKYVTVTLAVPVAQFGSARTALLGLGNLLGESVSGDLVAPGYGRDTWNTFSNITVQFRPSSAAITLPPIPSFGWNPARTFEQAFGVFTALFTFLVDLVIWVAVVIGPFVLMGLGLRALLHRMRGRS